MIIDAHTHYTTAPAELQAYRGRQITDLGKPARAKLQISDEQLERSMQGQFKRMKDSGIDGCSSRRRHRPWAITSVHPS